MIHKARLYRKCARCECLLPLMNDGRLMSHLTLNDADWCPGAPRPSQATLFEFDDSNFDAVAHEAHHKRLYRALRELTEDWSKQTGLIPKAEFLSFLGWCKKQHNTPDHDDPNMHLKR